MSHSLFQLRDIFSLQVSLLQFNTHYLVWFNHEFDLAFLMKIIVEAKPPARGGSLSKKGLTSADLSDP